MDPRLADALEHLYSGSSEDFVARRARLAAELSGQGLKAEAAELEKRRRPSVAAAAVNDVVRSHPDEMHALAAVGDRMRVAQDDALAGRGATDLRAANRARKVLVDQLTDAALAVLAVTSSQSEAYRTAIADTFEAATIDPAARAQVESGALVKELSLPSGLGAQAAVVPTPKRVSERAAKAVVSDDAEAARAKRALAKAAVADARRAQREAQRAADRDDAAAMSAGATADEAARAVSDLEEQLAEARRADREARTAARVADQAARASAATAAKATDRLDALERERDGS